MSPSGITRSFFVTFLVLLCLKSSCAVNITQILKGYPNFSKMTDVLSQPDVAKQMNIQPAITILALDNDAMDTLSATKRPEEVTDIVKCHVAFDYYDVLKMNNRQLNHPAEMVNLYMSSGTSEYGQGLIQLKKTSKGIVFFSTSTNSTANDAKFVETVYTRQFNLSIIKIDHPMLILGLNDAMPPARAPLPPKAAANNTAPANGTAPANDAAPASDAAPAPAPEEDDGAAESPSDDTYQTEAPARSPAEGPVADEASSPDADTADQEVANSSAGKRVVGLALVFASAFLTAVAL